MKLHHKIRVEFRIVLGSWLVAAVTFAFAFCSSAQTTAPLAVAKGNTAKSKESVNTTVQQSPWNCSEGWHGVVAGKSTLKDAETKLGPGKLLLNQNGFLYYQFGSGVKMTLLSSNSKVQDIEVTNEVSPDPQFPRTKKEAERKYYVLGGNATGVRTTFSSGADPQLTKLQFYEVKIVDDDTISRDLHHKNYIHR